jgi:excisionase family DNA binding protein
MLMLGTEVLTLQEAAAILKCHPKTLRLMAMEGKIPSRRVGRLWRFSLAKIKEWLNGKDKDS